MRPRFLVLVLFPIVQGVHVDPILFAAPHPMACWYQLICPYSVVLVPGPGPLSLVPWDPGIHGIPWDPMGSPWDPMGSYFLLRIPWLGGTN